MEEDYSHALDSPGSSVTLVGHSSGWRVQGASSKRLTKVLLARSIAPVLCVRVATEGAEASADRSQERSWVLDRGYAEGRSFGAPTRGGTLVEA